MMFVAVNLLPSGTMTSRADLLGFTDEEIGEINSNRADPERIARVNNALQVAAMALYARPVEGSVH